MQIKVLAFAQAREQLGFGEQSVECAAEETPRAILRRIAPGFDVSPVRVAVNRRFADWDQPVGQAFELAVISPVSGG
jgi:molybdopterin converting factor small subunit